MDPISLVKEQEKLGNQIVSCYNSLSTVAQSSIPSEDAKMQVFELRQQFKEFSERFEMNDRELRPPSATMERNAYFKGKFVDDVKNCMKNFNALYGQLKNRFIEEEKIALVSSKKDKDDARQRVPTASLTLRDPIDQMSQDEPRVPLFTMEQFSLYTEDLKKQKEKMSNSKEKNSGLVRQFQYILDDFESKLNKFKNKEVTIEILKEKFKMAENQFIHYMGEFPDDELTDIFYNLRDEYLNIPGIESYAKNLPFQLPAVDIPIFNGRATEWDTFRELFEQLIIDQPVSNTQKMCMLKAKLSGEAAKKISKLPSKDENFETAWSILNEYYSDKRAITSIYFKSILDAPFVTYNVKSVNIFLNNVNESLQALEAMKLNPEEMQKAFLCFILQRKLDDYLRIQFEQHLGKSKDLPKVESLIEFLKQIHYSLEASQDFTKGDKRMTNPLGMNYWSWEANQNVVNPPRQTVQTAGASQRANPPVNTFKTKCPLKCSVGHILYRCYKFKKLSINEKWDKVLEHKICSRCLGYGHLNKTCSANIRCRSCNGDHHTLLHREKAPAKTVVINGEEDDEAVLSTAIVEVKDGNGEWINCRVLLDGGAQVNIISKKFRNKLNIAGWPIMKELEGLEMKKSSTDEKIGLSLRSKVTKYKTFLNAVVMEKFVSNIPATKMRLGEFPSHIKLADPRYNIPQGVDLLLSNQFVFDLIRDGKMVDKTTNTKLRNTKLGWVVYGLSAANDSTAETSVVNTIRSSCDEILEKFWEVEEIPKINKITAAEKQCEKHFDENVKRLMDGKFQVRLPFKEKSNLLGDSSIVAKRRFFALERKLEKNYELRVQYNEFLKTYLKMGHMEILKNNVFGNSGYYLPHHCVLRPESKTTKLRVVFDASCKTTTNISLNEILHTGPRIQKDLFNILLRFRKHRYVFSADIEKMYRQIWVDEADSKYQLIYWRWNTNEQLCTYRLKTVTYGTASAPYLAVKCLQKIADDKESSFPIESKAIRNDFYMDDLMTGGDSLEFVQNLRKNIENILLEFGMPLRKWCANEKSLLGDIDSSNIASDLNIEANEINAIKILGVIWNPKSDKLKFKSKWEIPEKISKRIILGEIAKLFDPLGLVGPVIVTTKILLQELWKLEIDWDEKVPSEIQVKWETIRNNFIYLNEVNICRHIICHNPMRIELHGFCDASMKAYGAAIYVKSTDAEGRIHSHLAASKSRVAPIKIQTLPRLELCASVLLVELMEVVKDSLDANIKSIKFYTDSTIVLSWIKIDPARLQTFVSNRVSFIQKNSDINDWRHVKSEENPADLISRGIFAKSIVDNQFWFEGPIFLKEPEEYVGTIEKCSEILEMKKSIKIMMAKVKDSVFSNINHKNSFRYLQNVIAYVLKFVHLAKKRDVKPFIFYKKEALNIIVKDIQCKHFNEEFKMLKSGKCLHKSSNLTTLAPFIDGQNIIRVGGRLENSSLEYDAKHPILLPYKNEIVELLIEQLHRDHLHVGPQGLLAIIRQQFWPLRGKQLIKKVVNKCYRCFRIKPRQLHQLMGNLPEDRVIRTRPFLNVGIDFLGPITIHYKIRGKKTDKSYVCVFVCFATKAVHLEVVSDLTSAAFIGALSRFVARRGCPLKIFSDNATNFIGAANSLNEIYKLFCKAEHNKNINEFCGVKGIQWMNIPARSPHVGGLWEACVKSVKKHFYRVTEGTMTYEELYTLMTQIESILNSRPLTPLSDDPNDLNVLTPGHFLIGEALQTFSNSIQNKCYQGLREHWKAVNLNVEKFWERWSMEYLSELQKRFKWKKPSENIKPGTLVLLKEDNIPPMSWRRGRVIRTIMGSDGICRMVDIRTNTGETKRSIHNVCPFPTDDKTKEDESGSNPLNVNIVKNIDIKYIKSIENNNYKDKNINYENINNEKKKNSNSNDNLGKRNKLKNKNMIILLMSLLAIISPVKSQFKINRFKNEAGIFFDRVATVGLTKTSWSITVHVNISEYISAMNSLEEAMMSLGKMETKESVFQSSSYQNFQVLYERMENRHEMIMATAQARQKRSLLPFVGGVFHSLFGVMDEEHAEEVSRKLKENKMNDEYLLNVVRNLSSVQDITMDIIRKQNKAIFKDIERLSGAIKFIEKEIHDSRDESTRIAAITNILTSLEVVEKIQDDLIGAIFNAKGNLLNGILPLKKFRTQIELIKANLHKNLRLPTEDPVEVAKVSKVSTRTKTDFVLFSIQIPLINNEVFHAYEAYQYPTMHDGFSVNIHIKSRYFLIDNRKALYYILDNGNFEHCQRMRDLTLCHQVHPLFSTRAITDCEVQLFLRARKLPDNCEIEIKKPHNYWRQTHAPNTWIYSVYEESSAEVTCYEKIHHVSLFGSGIITMEADCHLEAGDLNLWAYDTYTTDVNYVFPTMNISKLIPKLNHLKLNSEMEIYKIPNIPKQTTILGFPIQIEGHHLNHYGMSFVTFIIIMVIIFALFWILRRTCQISSTYLPATVALPRLI